MIVPADADNTATFELPTSSIELEPWTLSVNDSQVARLHRAAIEDLRKQRAKKRAAVASSKDGEGEGKENKEQQAQQAAADKEEEDKIDVESFKPSWTVTAAHYLPGGHVLLGLMNKEGTAEIRAVRLDRSRRSR
jgi:ribosomal protein L12E/L44/L45/RPP1/RPP2